MDPRAYGSYWSAYAPAGQTFPESEALGTGLVYFGRSTLFGATGFGAMTVGSTTSVSYSGMMTAGATIS